MNSTQKIILFTRLFLRKFRTREQAREQLLRNDRAKNAIFSIFSYIYKK